MTALEDALRRALCVRCKVLRQPGQRWRQTCPTCQEGTAAE